MGYVRVGLISREFPRTGRPLSKSSAGQPLFEILPTLRPPKAHVTPPKSAPRTLGSDASELLVVVALIFGVVPSEACFYRHTISHLRHEGEEKHTFPRPFLPLGLEAFEGFAALRGDAVEGGAGGRGGRAATWLRAARRWARLSTSKS